MTKPNKQFLSKQNKKSVEQFDHLKTYQMYSGQPFAIFQRISTFKRGYKFNFSSSESPENWMGHQYLPELLCAVCCCAKPQKNAKTAKKY